MEYGIATKDGFYIFRYSPLGLLRCNIFQPPMERPPVQDVTLCRRVDGEWHSLPWNPHLWWARFCVVAYDTWHHTRFQPYVDWDVLDTILRAWLLLFSRLPFVFHSKADGKTSGYHHHSTTGLLSQAIVD